MTLKPRLATALLIHFVAAALWACAPNALEFPAYPLLLIELSIAAALFPAARLNIGTPLTPMNWALFLWNVHAVVVPLLALWFGFDPGTLPGLPASSYINEALLLTAVAHFCFCTGAQLAALIGPPAGRAPHFSSGFNAMLALSFIGVGILAMAFTFGSPAGFIHYITSPGDQFIKDDAPATLQQALGTLLKPFLSLGLILAWSNALGRRRTRAQRFVLLTLLLLVVLIPATANFNRASMVGPVLCVLAAYSQTVKRLSTRTVMLVGGALLMGALLVGAYRSSVRPPGAPPPREVSTAQNVNMFLQVYAAAPQFTGFVLDRAKDQLHLGVTLLSSALYPVPVLGKNFRQSSGFVFYNRLIYGRFGITDQVIPADAEVFLNFHLGGVALFFFAVGFLVRRLHEHFKCARTAFEAAACYLVATWLSFPIVGAVAVVSQILIYSFLPFYAYFGLRYLLGALRLPVPRREVFA